MPTKRHQLFRHGAGCQRHRHQLAQDFHRPPSQMGPVIALLMRAASSYFFAQGAFALLGGASFSRAMKPSHMISAAGRYFLCTARLQAFIGGCFITHLKRAILVDDSSCRVPPSVIFTSFCAQMRYRFPRRAGHTRCCRLAIEGARAAFPADAPRYDFIFPAFISR